MNPLAIFHRAPIWLQASLVTAITLAVIGYFFGAHYLAHPLHAPDLSILARQDFAIQLHVAAALVTLVVGAVILAGAKGRGLHKVLGWIWVASMGTTAFSSLFITGLNGDMWSWIHLISGWTIVSLPMAIYAIRQKRIMSHRKAMVGMYLGGMLVAGLFTFLPGRLMFEVFFG